MRTSRNVGQFSALHLLRARRGLGLATAEIALDAEERRRFERFEETCAVLGAAQAAKLGDVVSPAKVRKIDERVDRVWYALRDTCVALGRVPETALGEEASRLERRYLDMAFLRLDGFAQVEHGQELLRQLEKEKLSAALKGALGPLFGVLRRDQEEYASVLDESMVAARQASALGPARNAAAEALQSFVSFVEVSAETDDEVARAEAILRPVDAVLAKAKRREGNAPPPPAEQVSPPSGVEAE